MMEEVKNFLLGLWDGVWMFLLAFFFANSFHIGMLLGAWCDGVDVWAILKEAF